MIVGFIVSDDTDGIPEEVETEASDCGVERTWRDYDEDGQLITGGGEEEWY